ncbi:LamG-like jellyroll fold domain-containing protein [Oceaniferula spumae]
MKPREAEQLIQQLFDGTIAERDFHTLEEELALDSNLRATYKEYAMLHSSLEAADVDETLILPESPEVLLRQQKLVTLWLSVGVAVASVLVFALVLRFVYTDPAPQHIAMRSSAGTVMRVTSAEGEVNTSELVPGSSVEVTQGVVELRFPSGVKSLVTGPANLEVVSGNEVALHEGVFWAHVPEGAEGFQVRAPGMHVTDLGTAFGMVVVPGSAEDVYVLDGEVKVQSLSGKKEEVRLTAGESRRLDNRGRLVAAPKLSQSFTTELPESLHYFHFSFDEVHGDTTPVAGNHPMLADMNTRLKQSDARPARERVVKGRFGNAITFDGLGDIIETNWPGVYGSQALTVALWVRPEGKPNYGGLLGWGASKIATSEPNQWKVLLAPSSRGGDNTRFRAAWGAGIEVSQRMLAPRGKWIHLAMVYTGDEVKFYVNGKELIESQETKITPPQRPGDLLKSYPLVFGDPMSQKAARAGQFLRGVLDEVYIVEGALTDSQIKSLYRSNSHLSGAR